jgi:beta-xylosidase
VSSEAGYRNPVIPGFHPDPSVCRVDDTYYLVTSSFTYFPGIPIFRSIDLVSWEQIGNVLDRPSQLDLEHTSRWGSFGVCAPTIRFHDDRFWVIVAVTTEKGAPNYFVTADDPAGPWSDPVYVDLPGIDPDLSWDAEGTCWVHWAGMHITRVPIDDRTGRLLAEPQSTWSGTGMAWPEAPHLFERNGVWYLLIAEGGTERGHAASIARGPSPAGPWEANPSNPILSHRSTDSPIQNTGHADLVEAVDGSWWLVALGVRPQGTTPGYHVLGRETYLAPIEWIDGWPVVGPLAIDMPSGPPGARSAPTTNGRDDFDGGVLDPRWMALRRPPSDFVSLEIRPGWLILQGGEQSLDDTFPAYVGRRQQHIRCRVATLVEAEQDAEAGLAVYMDERSHYEIAVAGDRIIARARIGPLSSIVGDAPRPAGAQLLVAETSPESMGGDVIRLGFAGDDGEITVLAELDGRYLSTEVASGFVGRTIGMYAIASVAAFDWFEYQSFDD